ncbi:hypothetical protein AK812_SmicGene33775 [Symbiodinium microadriaticum]|uniref:Uncharacterized protein n=1 Tax=Symbiodinium microadriaticum TaxID=2951 RepID=A0A1Q9CQR4_SYMMI|nr:hypothetical protein AK812_SmicGene33775 [Symbiodinium microadriaticum]
MGGPRRRGWVLVGLPSCFLSGSWVGWVGRGKEAGLPLGSLHIFFLGAWVGWVSPGLPLGSLHVSFFLRPGSDGWAAAKKLGSLHIAFLGSWVGWVGRGQEAGLALGSLHVSFFLGPGSDGCHWASFMRALVGTQKEGNMKGAQREPSFLAAAHPSDPAPQKGNMKGAR